MQYPFPGSLEVDHLSVHLKFVWSSSVCGNGVELMQGTSHHPDLGTGSSAALGDCSSSLLLSQADVTDQIFNAAKKKSEPMR